MSSSRPLMELLQRDPRYSLDAYLFVREALAYAQEELQIGGISDSDEDVPAEAHLTGQQLCEAIRLYALEQFGMLARLVLNSWGVTSTGDLGDIVYNLIDIEQMKKSPTDRREDFDDVYDFDQAFEQQFQITRPES